jgi:hypothetical protein
MQGFGASNKRLSVLVILIGLGLIGCAHRQPILPSSNTTFDHMLPKLEKSAVVPIPGKLPCVRRYQEEISRLKQLLAEKDELIRSQSIREMGREQVLQETTSEFSRTKSQLHRLATQPEAASKIAEVEVLMDSLKQAELEESDFALQSLAQRLLDAATIAYRQMDYSRAMNYAAQSREFISMVANSARKMLDSQHVIVILRTPFSLRITHDTDLRAEPSSHSESRGLLAKNSAVTATAYQSNWLRLQTEDGRIGWIQNTMVDIRIGMPELQSSREPQSTLYW